MNKNNILTGILLNLEIVFVEFLIDVALYKNELWVTHCNFCCQMLTSNPKHDHLSNYRNIHLLCDINYNT